MAAAPGPATRGNSNWLVIIVNIIWLLGCESSKLNFPKVLLPVSEGQHVNFTLVADDGCYTWYSTRPNIVSILPLYENGTNCSQHAVLIAQSLQSIRLSSVIIAEEVVTGWILRCDAIVDVINSIEIESTTRELYVEDSPLELTVRALDVEGNTFSSLAGIPFEWNIVKDEKTPDSDPASKIRILKFSEAEYLTPEYISEMENQGKQGDIILVSGIQTGTAKVKVRIQEKYYKKVCAAMVRLLVLENILLFPFQEVFMLVGDRLQCTLFKIVQGKISEVVLTEDQYELQLQNQEIAPKGDPNSPVACLDQKTGIVTALQLGQASLILLYKSILSPAVAAHHSLDPMLAELLKGTMDHLDSIKARSRVPPETQCAAAALSLCSSSLVPTSPLVSAPLVQVPNPGASGESSKPPTSRRSSKVPDPGQAGTSSTFPKRVTPPHRTSEEVGSVEYWCEVEEDKPREVSDAFYTSTSTDSEQGRKSEPCTQDNSFPGTDGLCTLTFLNSLIHNPYIHMHLASALPNTTIHVVKAAFITFSVHPGERWVLQTGGLYEIEIEIFDISGNQIILYMDRTVLSEISVSYFEILMSSPNGTYHLVRVLTSGHTVINATLPSFFTKDISELDLIVQLHNSQEVDIYRPITLIPSMIAFPWQLDSPLYYYQIEVVGGSGNFSWFSSNQTVAKVTVKGVVTAGPTLGESIILARDKRNQFHYGEMTVYVLIPVKLELMPSRADVEVGQILELPFMMYGILDQQMVMFYDCSIIHVLVEIEKRKIFAVAHGRLPPGPTHCSGIRLRALSSGSTIVTVSSVPGEEQYYSSATIAAYELLKSVEPISVALVTLRSHKEVELMGGPKPWVLEPSQFFTELYAEYEERVEIVKLRMHTTRSENVYRYQVTCTDYGEQLLTFRVGNKPSLLNPYPAVEVVQVKFVCALPASLSLTPLYSVLEYTRPCPLPHDNKQLVPVSSLRSMSVELSVLDHHGRKFDNFSSLLLECNSSNETLAYFHQDYIMKMVAKADGSGQKRLHGHRTVSVHGLKGTVSITVSFRGYKEGVEAVSPQDLSLLPTSATLELLLVDDVVIEPDNLTIFNHPSVQENLYLMEGSGYFLITSSDQTIVNATYYEAESYISVVPLLPGKTVIEIYDLCLPSSSLATAYIEVSDISDFYLNLVSKVEINKVVPVRLWVLDYYRRSFLRKYTQYMDLHLQTASSIISIESVEDVEKYSLNYIIRTLAVGQTNIFVTTRDRTGRKITHMLQQLEVFPPFRLIPPKMTLIIGNMMQIMSEGGPQPHSHIHFTISNSTVASVNELGQVTGLELGSAEVVSTIQSVSEVTGNVIVFSQDNMEVEVVQLRGIRIHVPTTRLVTNTEMPVFVMGLSSAQTPFAFGNVNPMLVFHWTTSKRDVVEVRPRHSEAYLQLLPENNFAMMVHTLAPGRTGLKVTVHALEPSAGQFEGNRAELSDEIQIQVFEKFRLSIFKHDVEQILISPNSQLRLTTNRDDSALVSIRIVHCLQNSTVIVEEGKQGLLVTGSSTSQAVIELTSLEPFGIVQNIITGVKVAPVSYVTISTSPELHMAHGQILTAFPLGVALTFTIHFYDSIGEMFHAQSMQLQLNLNRDDLLQISLGSKNSSYLVHAVNEGETLLRIQDRRHPGIADYIPIPVYNAIRPDALHIVGMGDVICFSCPLVSREGELGIWQTDSIETLQIDSGTGVGLARHSGKATVYYEVSGLVRTYREVEVSKSKEIVFNYPANNYLRNSPSAAGFKVSVSAGDTGKNVKGACTPSQLEVIQNQLLPESNLACSLEFVSAELDIQASEVFSVTEEFSMEAGHYICSIRALPQSSNVQKTLSTADISVVLKVSLFNEHFQDRSRQTLIPFIPEFYVNQSEVTFSKTQLTNTITVLGTDSVLEKLKIYSDSPLIEITEVGRSDEIPQMDIYLVSVVKPSFLQQRAAPPTIYISSPLTRQSMTVAVRIVREEQNLPALAAQHQEAGLLWQLLNSYQVLFFTLFAVLASTSVIYIAYNTLLTQIQNVPVVFVPTPVPTDRGYNTYGPQQPYSSLSTRTWRNRMNYWLWSTH
nr:PREDICTED: nuclear pore membrane glycoprotein 210-like [Latimeria chalumnae]|eukprot:XP_014349605.1 PREDICTED: nuclear pore membrane glycoprotein 210-like [Latimeria chalumnae]